MAKGPPPPLKPKPKVPPPVAVKKPNVTIPGSSPTDLNASNTGNTEHAIPLLENSLRNSNKVHSYTENKEPLKEVHNEIGLAIPKPIILTSIDTSGTNDMANVKNKESSSVSKIARFPPPPKRNVSHPKLYSKPEEMEASVPRKANGPAAKNTDLQVSNRSDIDLPQDLASIQNESKSHKYVDTNVDSDEEEENKPLLPARPRSREPGIKKTIGHKVSDVGPDEPDEPDVPKLPNRPLRPSNSDSIDDDNRPSFLSPRKPVKTDVKKLRESNLDFETLTFERGNKSSSKFATQSQGFHAPATSSEFRGNDKIYNNEEEGSEFSSTERSEFAGSHSSQILDSAKHASKAGYHSAVGKTTPLAKQAKHSLNKWKDKISNSTSSLPEVDNTGDEYYQSRAARAKAVRSQSPYNSALEHDNDDSEDDDVFNPDISIDEDRPPLPKRKGVPSRPANGPPPPNPISKAKRDPVKKVSPAVPPKRLVSSSGSSTNGQSQRLVTPPPLVSRSTPPVAPPSRGNVIPSVHKKPSAPPPRTKSSIPVAPPSRKMNVSLVPPTNTPWTEPELDLEFPSLWFVNPNDLKLPECLKGLNYQISAGFAANKEFRIYVLRGKDLSTIRLKLTWNKDSGEPLATLSHELKFIPPPMPTKELLLSGHTKYGEHVANWCEVKIGRTIGNGECWTLAHDALEKGCGKHAFVSSGLVHGALLYTIKATGDEPTVVIPSITDEIKRGDILQFRSCFFKYPTCTMTYGAPDHTAVVRDVRDGFISGALKELSIIQQNFNGNKTVSEATIDLGRLKGGDIKIYRPIDSNWVTNLADFIL